MNPLNYLLTTQLKRSRQQQKTSGFTLIELLVGIIMAALVIGPLLGFMINILDTDRKEQAKTNTEQELQAALDYIARDLEQSVYIYDAKGVDEIRDQLPAAPANTAEWEPVLVFWKRQVVQNIVPIGGANCANTPENCDDTFVYSLVAYFLSNPTNCTTSTWSCTKQIHRFQTRDAARKQDGTSAESADPGFNSFVSLLSAQNVTAIPGDNTYEKRMNSWTKAGGTYSQTPQVLIDFVDQSTDNVPQTACPQENNDDPDETANARWEQVPANADTFSFYACVDPSRTTAKLFIRGNSLARLNPKDNDPPEYEENKSAYFPRASIQVKGRGFIEDKED